MNASYDSQYYLSNAVETLSEFVTCSMATAETNFEIQDFDFHPVNFEVIEEFDLYPVTSEDSLTGRVAIHDSDTLVTNNISKYRGRCDHLRQFEQSSPTVLEECKATISHFKLAQFESQRQEICVHQNKHRIIHHCTCPTCAGDGSVSCPSCNSTQYEPCSSCGGHGDHTCHHCGGCGYQIEVGYERDSRGDSVRQETVVSCYCNGGRNTCSSCRGCGEIPCSNCSNGYVSCNNCDATGWNSQIFSVATLANYDISHRDTTHSMLECINSLSGQFIDTLGFKSLSAGHAHQLNRLFVRDTEQTKIQLISRFEAPAITLCSTVDCGGQLHGATIEIFGANFFILDADNIFAPIITSQTETLTHLREDIGLAFHTRGRKTLYEALIKALSLPISQKVFKAHFEDQTKSNEAISRSIHSSIEPSLIGTLISDTKTLLAFINLWRFSQLMFSSLFAYVALTTVIFFKDHVHHLDSIFVNVDRNTLFSFTSLVYFPGALLAMQLCESYLNNRHMRRTFGDCYLIAKQVQSVSTLGAFHSRFFIALLLFLVIFFAAL